MFGSMDLIPERRSLLSSTTAMLRDAIEAGEWTDLMPGERKLCERMKVGRDTLRLALKQLEREKLIGKGDPGKRRPILFRPKDRSRKKSNTVGSCINYLTPHRLEQMTETSLTEIDVLRAQLADSGVRLEIVNTSAFAMERPGARLGKILSDEKADAWILHQTTAPMQRWFQEKGVPCILHGLPHEKIDLPFVDLDYFAVGRHAGGFLSGRGHRRIALLRPSASLRGLELAENGLRDAIEEPLLVYTEQGDADGLRRQMQLMVGLKAPPTAIVATRSRQVLTILTHLAQAGLCVPRDLSIVLLDHNLYLKYLVPPIACYRVDTLHAAKTLARKVLELAGTGSTTRTIPPLMPEFLQGGSVGKI